MKIRPEPVVLGTEAWKACRGGRNFQALLLKVFFFFFKSARGCLMTVLYVKKSLNESPPMVFITPALKNLEVGLEVSSLEVC